MNPLIPTFFFTIVVFILLILITLSTPIIQSLYFLKATVPGETLLFGIWGFCSNVSGCTSPTLGYHRSPEIVLWLTQALVLFPIATVFAFICAVGLFPSVVVFRTRDTIFPPPLQSLAAVPTAISSVLAFIFMIVLFAIAKSKFDKEPSSSASFGPLIWMSLVAMIIQICVTFYTGCGSTWRGPLGEWSPHIRNQNSAVYTYTY